MRPQDVEDVRRYRYAAKHHSRAELRAAAACKALAWQGMNPTAAAVSKLAVVEFSVAEETVDLWHGTRPLVATRAGTARAVEAPPGASSSGSTSPARPPAVSTSAGWRSRRPPT
jgi:hypothetical protein